MMYDLTGKNALITGAGGGIGKAIAKSLHKQGANLILADIIDSGIKDLQNELKDRVNLLPCLDISLEENAVNIIDIAEKDFNGVDILINNAGITKDNISIRMEKKDWDDVISINLTTPFLLSKYALSKMMKRRWGRIINIASVVGVMGNYGQSNYSASKGGLIALTKTLAREFAQRGITVNSVAPGFIETKMTAILPEDQKKLLLNNIPLGKMGTPEDVSNAVVFLASKESEYITGQTINVNGGMVMV